MAPANDTHNELIQNVGTELNELRQAADRLDEAVAALYSLNRTDLRCLGILYRRGRVTAGELAEESGLTPGAITTALDRMEKGGYANRVADPEDRRRVLVLSTVAAREIGARLYGEVEVASHRLLDPRTEEELTAIRDYLRGTRAVYEGQTEQVAACLAGPNAAGAGAAGATAASAGAAGIAARTAPGGATPAEASAPLAGTETARLEFTKGAAKVIIRGDSALSELYRARFEGPAPEVLVRGNTVTMQHRRRFRPFDWRAQSSDILLNTSIPWVVSFRGGMFKLSADLRGLVIQTLEVAGGASDVEVWLPAATGVIPIRVSGGASQVALHRPANVAMRVDMNGGASQLIFDGQRLGSIGGRNHLETTGFAQVADKYEVRFTGGASQITIDTEG